jgi:dihydropteroate synthase
MLMGVGNLTELTEVDSAGVNMILAGVCQELRVGSVLTTQVINWARSSVRELDLARRMMSYALSHATLPKHVDPRLVMLRDPKLVEMTADELDQIAGRITDPNYRVVVQDGAIHLFNRDGHWWGREPFDLIRQASDATGGKPLDPLHAFYLGYELCKAATALALHKQYTQDEPLQWGYLTVPDQSHVQRRRGVDPSP